MFYFACESAFPTWPSAMTIMSQGLCVCVSWHPGQALTPPPSPCRHHGAVVWRFCTRLGFLHPVIRGWDRTGKVCSDLPVCAPSGSCGGRSGLRFQVACLITQSMWEAGGHSKCGQRSMLGGPRMREALCGLTEGARPARESQETLGYNWRGRGLQQVETCYSPNVHDQPWKFSSST